MPYRPIETREAFHRAIKIGETTEGLHLDFKREIKPKKGDAQAELCRDIAQFANTEGGTLLIGVEEAKGPNGQKVASRLHPIEDVDAVKQWIEQSITNHCVPSTFSKTVEAIQLEQGIVLAVNISPSIHLVALWHRDESGGRKNGCIEYLYRTNHGKEWMNPDAAERHLMDGSRAARLAVKELFAREDLKSKNLELVPAPISRRILQRKEGDGLMSYRPIVSETNVKGIVCLTGASDSECTIQFARGETLAIPYAFIEATWITTDLRPAIGLSVRIVNEHKRFSLEPFAPIKGRMLGHHT